VGVCDALHRIIKYFIVAQKPDKFPEEKYVILQIVMSNKLCLNLHCEKNMNKEEVGIAEEVLMQKIYLVNGFKVMLDSDLAELYQVETKR
jgi:hypothetical protein